MKTIHAKSWCCGAPIIRYGGSRRQCIKCRGTWRFRPKRRGRKRRRVLHQHLLKVFREGWRVKQLSHRGIKPDTTKKRFQQMLLWSLRRRRHIRIAGKYLALIIDAQWRIFKGKRWTLYFLAVKSSDHDLAVVFDPRLRPGKESAEDWAVVFKDCISPSLRQRIIALISDGIPGSPALAAEWGWRQQRCHFHLIKEMYKRRGKRKRLKGRSRREAIYRAARSLLVTNKPYEAGRLKRRLRRLIGAPDCPKKFRMIVGEFLRHLSAFHLYLEKPHWHLPNTINVMESIGRIIRANVGRVHSPAALRRWATAVIRNHPKFVCKRANYQPN